MKRLLVTLILIFALSLPVLGGHNQVGGRWCECAPVQGACPCCGGGDLLTAAHEQENESDSQDASDITAPSISLGLIRLTFLMWLKS